MSVGKAPGDLLLTTDRGSQLHRSAVLRTLQWSTTGRGGGIHDLRHTAACLWLARGVDPGTVQAWMGHESIGTTNRYLHFLGTGADLVGSGEAQCDPGGHRGDTSAGDRRMTKREPRPSCVFPQVGRGFRLVELRGFEPLTFSLRTRRATNCATAPWCGRNDNTTVTAAPNLAGRRRTPRRRLRRGARATAGR